jgi:hypothetical protein
MKMGVENLWNDTDRDDAKHSERKTYPSVTLSTTNLTWTDLVSNPGLRDTLKLNYV